MNINIEKAVEYFKPYLLSEITLKTDKKILRKGKLKFFQIKQYFIKLIFDTDKGVKNYEIPYPFKITKNENNITTLNYNLTSFIKDDDILLKVKFLDSSSKSKIFDNEIYILPSNMT